jgi:hypothetical protein
MNTFDSFIGALQLVTDTTKMYTDAAYPHDPILEQACNQFYQLVDAAKLLGFHSADSCESKETAQQAYGDIEETLCELVDEYGSDFVFNYIFNQLIAMAQIAKDIMSGVDIYTQSVADNDDVKFAIGYAKGFEGHNGYPDTPDNQDDDDDYDEDYDDE